MLSEAPWVEVAWQLQGSLAGVGKGGCEGVGGGGAGLVSEQCFVAPESFDATAVEVPVAFGVEEVGPSEFSSSRRLRNRRVVWGGGGPSEWSRGGGGKRGRGHRGAGLAGRGAAVWSSRALEVAEKPIAASELGEVGFASLLVLRAVGVGVGGGGGLLCDLELAIDSSEVVPTLLLVVFFNHFEKGGLLE